MANRALSAVERETIIITNDAEKFWIISTHQKPKVAQLERLVEAGHAEKLADLTWGSQPGGEYKIPVNMVTIRNTSKRRTTARFEKDTCKGLTNAGKPCNMFSKENGYCFKHQDQAPKKRSRKKP